MTIAERRNVMVMEIRSLREWRRLQTEWFPSTTAAIGSAYSLQLDPSQNFVSQSFVLNLSKHPCSFPADGRLALMLIVTIGARMYSNCYPSGLVRRRKAVDIG
jgi:hypothetical protein